MRRIYVGISGRARRVKAAWVGVSGAARRCYSEMADPVLLFSGLSPSHLDARVAPRQDAQIHHLIPAYTPFHVVGAQPINGFYPVLSEENLYYVTAAFVQTNPSGFSLPRAVPLSDAAAIVGNAYKDLYETDRALTPFTQVPPYTHLHVLDDGETKNGRLHVLFQKAGGAVQAGWTLKNAYITAYVSLSRIDWGGFLEVYE